MIKVEGPYWECPTCLRKFWFEYEHDSAICITLVKLEAERQAEYTRKCEQLRAECVAFARGDPVFRQIVQSWSPDLAQRVAGIVADQASDRMGFWPDSSILWQDLYKTMLEVARQAEGISP